MFAGGRYIGLWWWVVDRVLVTFWWSRVRRVEWNAACAARGLSSSALLRGMAMDQLARWAEEEKKAALKAARLERL